jgi:hypothetical protein
MPSVISSIFAGMDPKRRAEFLRGADRAIGWDKPSSTTGPYIPFRRGGKIRKGSIAMKRKMAKLRAMRK